MKLRQAVLVTIIASVILASISLTNAYSAIPPTRGFAKIVSTAGTITANNATAKLNLVEGSNIDFAVNSLTNQLTISSTGGGFSGYNFTMNNPDANTAGEITGIENFVGKNDNGDVVNYARIESSIADPTAGAEAGIVHFQVQDYNGNLQDFITFDDFNNNGLLLRSDNAVMITSLDNSYVPDFAFQGFDSNNAITTYFRIGTLMEDTTAGSVKGGANLVGAVGAPFITMSDTDGVTIVTNAARKLAFHGATPTDQFAHISDPSGGVVQDAEARTAINDILNLLEEKGLMGT